MPADPSGSSSRDWAFSCGSVACVTLCFALVVAVPVLTGKAIVVRLEPLPPLASPPPPPPSPHHTRRRQQLPDEYRGAYRQKANATSGRWHRKANNATSHRVRSDGAFHGGNATSGRWHRKANATSHRPRSEQHAGLAVRPRRRVGGGARNGTGFAMHAPMAAPAADAGARVKRRPQP